MKLDQKLIDVFCTTYGEKYRANITLDTNMDAIEEWDSSSFFDLVLALEDAYGISFSDDEAAQLFQIGHIQTIVNNILLEKPQTDVSVACTNLYLLNKAHVEQKSITILSGSSTREGLLEVKECIQLLKEFTGNNNYSFYNNSVSGLVAAESLQLIDNMKNERNGLIVLGTSPIIWAGCGKAEFTRSINYKRFPFFSNKMEKILNKYVL